MNQAPQYQSPPQHDDEIDLFELWQTIWSQKWLVIGLTLFTMLGAAAYSFFATKTYSAEVVILQPSSQDIQALNVENISYSTDQVYGVFINELLSIEKQKQFLAEADAIDLFLDSSKPVLNPEQEVFKYFTDRFKYVPAAKNTQRDAAMLTFSYSQPELTASFLNGFFQFSLEQTKAKLLGEISSRITHEMQQLNLRIETLTKNAKSQRLQRIEVLQEALQIAQKAGFEEPFIDKQALTSSTEYLKGTKLLAAEIEALKQRTNDGAFVGEITELRQKLAYLESIVININDVRPVRVDQYALEPVSADKPKVVLIMAVAVVLGGMLGVFIALIRGAVLKRRQSHAE